VIFFRELHRLALVKHAADLFVLREVEEREVDLELACVARVIELARDHDGAIEVAARRQVVVDDIRGIAQPHQRRELQLPVAAPLGQCERVLQTFDMRVPRHQRRRRADAKDLGQREPGARQHGRLARRLRDVERITREPRRGREVVSSQRDRRVDGRRERLRATIAAVDRELARDRRDARGTAVIERLRQRERTLERRPRGALLPCARRVLSQDGRRNQQQSKDPFHARSRKFTGVPRGSPSLRLHLVVPDVTLAVADVQDVVVLAEEIARRGSSSRWSDGRAYGWPMTVNAAHVPAPRRVRS
jgi:hypothetical protein